MKNKFISLTLTLLLLFSYASNAFASEVPTTRGNDGNEISENLNNNEETKINIITKEFEFTINSKNVEKEYKLTGAIYYPEIYKYDKVFYFIHGRMIFNENAHHGFDYIIEKLNALGYRVISLNICDLYKTPMQTTLETDNVINAVNKSIKYIQTNEKAFGDIQTLSFIGHSRGGFHVLKVSENLLEQGYNIEHILSIAPYVLDWDKLSLPNVETTILVPEFDGDVQELDGAKIYANAVEKELERETTLRYIFLFGANHNFFSTEMKYDDMEYLLGTSYINRDYMGYKISKETQQDFLINTILKYMTTKENENISFNTLYNIKEYNSSFKCHDFNSIDLTIFNGTFLPIDIYSLTQNYNGYSYIIEPGHESSEYNIVRFNKENSYVTLDIQNNNYENIVFEMRVDDTSIRNNNVELEFTVVYENKESEIFKFDVNLLNGKLITKSRSPYYINAYWNRKLPFNHYSLDVDENYIVDKIIVKTNKISQLAFKNIYIDIFEAMPLE